MPKIFNDFFRDELKISAKFESGDFPVICGM